MTWGVNAMAASDNELDVLNEVREIRSKQRERWGLAHDKTHEPFEWLGLIVQCAAAGRLTDAAALCIAAEVARRE